RDSRRRILHSFPTRRSSDLVGAERPDAGEVGAPERSPRPEGVYQAAQGAMQITIGIGLAGIERHRSDLDGYVRAIGERNEPLHRSEEHTSELQSRENLVCRL